MAGSPLNDPRRPWGCFGCVGVVVAALLVIGGFAVWNHFRGPSEVSNPNVEFTGQAPPSTEPTAPADAEDSFDDGADWPMYGATEQRTRYLPFAGKAPIRPR